MFKEFIKNNLVNLFASLFIGIANWLLRFLVLKFTTPQTVTSFASFSSLILIFSFPGSWIVLMTLRLGVKFKESILKVIAKNRVLLLLSTLAIVMIFSVIFLLSNLGIILLIIALIIIFLGFFLSYYRGLLQHEMLFDRLGIIGVSEVILKLIIFLLLSFIGLNSSSVFIAYFIQIIISFIFLNLITKKLNSHKHEENIKRISILTFFYGLSFLLYTNIDTVFARIYLPLNQNLSYVGISQLGSLIFFGSSALINVLIPSIQKYKKRKEILFLSLITGLLSFMGVIFIIMFSYIEYDKVSQTFVFQILSKAQMLNYLFGMAFLSLSQIPLTILLVKNKNSLAATIILTIIFQILLYLIFGKNVGNFTNIYLAVGLFSLVIPTISLIFYSRNKNSY